MQWIDEDFKNMYFNVWQLRKNASVIKAFPVLGTYAEFQKEIKLDYNKVLRYICFAYDKGTPLPGKMENLLKTKLEAAELAGFEKTDKKFQDDVNKMILGKNNDINLMIVRFLSIFHDTDFMEFKTYKEAHFDIMDQIRNADKSDSKKYSELLKVADTLSKYMSDRINNIFHPEETREQIMAMYEMVDYEELEITPEKIAERIASGQNIIDHPIYGDWTPDDKYGPEDLE